MNIKEVVIDGIVYVPKEENNSTEQPKHGFKVGEWAKWENEDNGKGVFIISEIDESRQVWSKNPLTGSEDIECYYEDLLRPTSTDIETYLIKMAKEKGFLKMGTKFKSINDGEEGRIRTVKPYSDNDTIEWRYLEYMDELYCNNGMFARGDDGEYACSNPSVFIEGVWADIVPDIKPVPKTRKEFNTFLGAWANRHTHTTDEFLDQYDFNE